MSVAQNFFPSIESTVDSVARRLMIERGYDLLADVSEGELTPPGAEALMEKMDHTEDEDTYVALYDQLDALTEAHQSDWKAFGRPFPGPLYRDSMGEAQDPGLVAAPALLSLRDSVQRVLVKFTPLAIRMVVIVDQYQLGRLEQQALLTAAERLRSHFLGVEHDPEAKSKPSISVMVDVVAVGMSFIDVSTKRLVKSLVKRFNPRRRVFIFASALDAKSGEVFAREALLSLRAGGYFRHALRHAHQTGDEIYADMHRQRFSFGTVLLGVLALIAAHVAVVMLVAKLSWDIGLLYIVVHFLVPMFVVLGILSARRLRQNNYAHAKWMLMIWAPLYFGLHLAVAWPPSIGLIFGLAVPVAVVCMGSLLAGSLMDME